MELRKVVLASWRHLCPCDSSGTSWESRKSLRSSDLRLGPAICYMPSVLASWVTSQPLTYAEHAVVRILSCIKEHLAFGRGTGAGSQEASTSPPMAWHRVYPLCFPWRQGFLAAKWVTGSDCCSSKGLVCVPSCYLFLHRLLCAIPSFPKGIPGSPLMAVLPLSPRVL